MKTELDRFPAPYHSKNSIMTYCRNEILHYFLDK